MSCLIDLAQILKPLARTQISQTSPEGESPLRPDSVPPAVWEKLDFSQRVRRCRESSFATLSERARADVEQAVLLLKLAIPEIVWSPTMRAYTESLLQNTVVPLKNPAVPSLLRRISECLEAGRAPSMVISQCLEKGPQVRESKVNYFVRGLTGTNIEQWYQNDFEGVGWLTLRSLLH